MEQVISLCTVITVAATDSLIHWSSIQLRASTEHTELDWTGGAALLREEE